MDVGDRKLQCNSVDPGGSQIPMETAKLNHQRMALDNDTNNKVVESYQHFLTIYIQLFLWITMPFLQSRGPSSWWICDQIGS